MRGEMCVKQLDGIGGGEAFKTIRWEGRGEGMYKSDGWE